MKQILLVLASCAAMQAATITFGSSGPTGPTSSSGTIGFGNSTTYGNSATWTSSEGWTVTAQAFSLPSVAGTNTFLTAALQIFGSSNGQNLGLGVCNRSNSENSEGSNESCSQDQWQIDNNNPAGSDARDFVLFTFSQPVSVQSLLLLQSSLTSHDNDFDYYFDTTVSDTVVAGVTQLGTLGGQGFGGVNQSNGTPINDSAPFGCNNAGPCPTRTATLVANSGVYGLLIAARSGETDDYFKLSGLSATAVPEPGSMILLGAGLLGLGIAARRRKA